MDTKPRILVIDDEEVIRTLSEKILSSYGYEVITARQGIEGVAAFEQAAASSMPFSAVLLDLTLTEEMSGQEALRQLKQLDAGVKAIVCSGHSSDPAIVDWARHGFAGAVVKPFRAEDLVNVVKKVVGTQN